MIIPQRDCIIFLLSASNSFESRRWMFHLQFWVIIAHLWQTYATKMQGSSDFPAAQSQSTSVSGQVMHQTPHPDCVILKCRILWEGVRLEQGKKITAPAHVWMWHVTFTEECKRPEARVPHHDLGRRSRLCGQYSSPEAEIRECPLHNTQGIHNLIQRHTWRLARRCHSCNR